MTLFRRKTAEEIQARQAVRAQREAVRNARLVAQEQRLALKRVKQNLRDATNAENARRAEAAAVRATERAEKRDAREHAHPHALASHHVGPCGISCRWGRMVHPHRIPTQGGETE